MRIFSRKGQLDEAAVIERLGQEKDTEVRLWFVRDAMLMADADGVISEQKIELIKSLLASWGYKGEKAKARITWAKEYVTHTRRGEKLFK